MAGICTSPYPIEKVGDSPYPYSYPINAGIPRQNGDEFGQYPREQVYLPSLVAGGFGEAWRRSGDSLGVFIIYGFKINCKQYGCFILF